ncbi:MAG TPA: CopG family transcriptional regulator [Thermoanaerobaculia bacterium]|jgi:hypothetical protein|nr:CopG family transcriptional regulator [Thermoanaerobaculia bacterium]
MRTTLDIDEDVLVAVKQIAARQKTTAGKVLSDRARQGLSINHQLLRNGVPLMPRGPRGSRRVTVEMVNALRDED